ncbi:MAG: ABC transporter substrate-binding protein [Oscillospiraceae bacterium]|nr:ABC transporter substrate-binding protein [Oscillospiraceae bacterium]
MKLTKRWLRVAAMIMVAVLVVSIFAGCTGGRSGSELRTVRVSEVTRSVFYAPQYVALALGFFEDEGLSIDLVTAEGADRVMTAIISGAADIGLSGPEAAIYVFNEGREDHAVLFAQLTQRDGSFLMARQPDPNFEWESIRGAHLLPGRRGGMPYMTLAYVVSQAGLTPGVDVDFDSTIQFAAMTGAFLSGTADFVTVFEPTASTIMLEGRGYIVTSIGEWAGELPYTAYYAQGSFIRENPEVIQGFANALARGQQWVNTHTPEETAQVIAPFFPEADPVTMASAIANYKRIQAYAIAPMMSPQAFYRMQDIMEQSGELSERAPFDSLVDNSFARRAVESLG